MKKNFLLLIFCCLMISTNAQTTPAIGIQGGLNINSAMGSAVIKDYKTSLPSFNLGVHLNTPITKKINLRTLLQYEVNGWKYEGLVFETSPGSGTFVESDADFKLNYLSLYALGEYSMGNKFRFLLNAGPYIGFLLDNSVVISYPDPSTNDNVTVKFKSNTRKSVNVGLACGAGVQTDLTKKTLIRLDLRNNFGLTNVNDGSTKIKLNTFAISAGISYRLKH